MSTTSRRKLELEYVAPGKWVTTDGRFGVIKKFKPINPMETSELPAKNRRHIFSVRDLRERTFTGLYYELAPEIYQAQRFADVHPWLSEFNEKKPVEESRARGGIKEIHLYDFDNTLFRSPYPPSEWGGDKDKWWKQPGSLNPPCVPRHPDKEWWNGNVVSAAKRSMKSKGVMTVLLTGRKEGVYSKRVKELIGQVGLRFDHMKMKGDDRTLPFKLRELEALVDKHKPEKLVIWEDRRPHLKGLSAMVRAKGIEVEEHFVPERAHAPACSVAELGEDESMPAFPVLTEARLTLGWIKGVEKWWLQWRHKMSRRYPVKSLRAMSAFVNSINDGIEFVAKLQEEVFVKRGLSVGDLSGNRDFDVNVGSNSTPKGRLSWMFGEVQNSFHEFWSVLATLRDNYNETSDQSQRDSLMFYWKMNMADWPDLLKAADKNMKVAFKAMKSFQTSLRTDKKGRPVDIPEKLNMLDSMEVSVGRMKVIWPRENDTFSPIMMALPDIATVRAATFTEFVKMAKRVESILRKNGFKHLWYGEMFVSDLAKAPQIEKDGRIETVSGGYSHKRDDMVFFMSPTPDFMSTLLHELGHRHYFKFMRRADRQGFREYFGRVPSPSKYGATKPEEDFAEVFFRYMLKQDLTKEQRERFKAFAFGNWKKSPKGESLIARAQGSKYLYEVKKV